MFPDVTILNDTLTLLERDFLSQMAQKQIPFDLRIEEFAFEQSEKNKQAEISRPSLSSVDFKSFIELLEEESELSELLASDEIQSYLRWRLLPRIAQRMEQLGRSIELRLERDPVLTEALNLLESVERPAELFSELKKTEPIR